MSFFSSNKFFFFFFLICWNKLAFLFWTHISQGQGKQVTPKRFITLERNYFKNCCMNDFILEYSKEIMFLPSGWSFLSIACKDGKNSSGFGKVEKDILFYFSTIFLLGLRHWIRWLVIYYFQSSQSPNNICIYFDFYQKPSVFLFINLGSWLK